MPIWPALLVAPSLSLADVSIAFALVTPACAAQDTAWLHVSSVGFLALSLLFTAMAAAEARRRARSATQGSGADSDLDSVRPYFTARVAVLVGLLSSLVIVGVWIPQWLLSPCTA
jgi:hypothetical protein